jgi:hypothetical protein
MSVEQTLEARGERYGKFETQGKISQHLKEAMRHYPGWSNLTDSQRESLDMIQHKISRILNGDPNYADSWHDITGYAKLIEDQINGVSR